MLLRSGKGQSSELRALKPRPGVVIGAVPGADALASKRILWARLCTHLGRARAATIMPETFLIDLPSDRARFEAQASAGSSWFLKHPTRQARRGIRVPTVPFDLHSAAEQGFTLLQRPVPRLRLVHGHRMHLRRYLVVVARHHEVHGYLLHAGKCVYARDPWRDDDTSRSTLVTTTQDGWTGPADAPRDLPGLRRTLLAATGADPDALERSMIEASSLALAATAARLDAGRLHAHRCFQLFGVDFVFDDQDRAWLLELNKRPNMRAQDAQDARQKQSVVAATLNLGLGRDDASGHRLGCWSTQPLSSKA
ncbi:MAG: hypothetical protein AAF799_06035 [Myxococcota bacterium]